MDKSPPEQFELSSGNASMAPRPATTAGATKKKLPTQSEFSQPRKRRPFTVFLVMDDREMRESLADSLRSQKIVVEDYMTAMEFHLDYRRKVPGVLVVDLRLRGLSGRELLEKLKAEKVDLPMIFLAGHTDAPTAIEAIQNGALDFLIKPTSEARLLAAVARAYASCYDVDWDFVGDDLDEIERNVNRITAREREVLNLIIEGNSSRDIGDQLGISAKTVEAHRAGSMIKSGLMICRTWSGSCSLTKKNTDSHTA